MAASERLRIGRVCRAARRVTRREAGRVWSVWLASALQQGTRCLLVPPKHSRSRRCTIGAVYVLLGGERGWFQSKVFKGGSSKQLAGLPCPGRGVRRLALRVAHAHATKRPSVWPHYRA